MSYTYESDEHTQEETSITFSRIKIHGKLAEEINKYLKNHSLKKSELIKIAIIELIKKK